MTSMLNQTNGQRMTDQTSKGVTLLFLLQINKKPTVILKYSSSCIDLISTTQQIMAGFDNSPENTVPLQAGVRQFRRTRGDANERESSKSKKKGKAMF